MLVSHIGTAVGLSVFFAFHVARCAYGSFGAKMQRRQERLGMQPGTLQNKCVHDQYS